MALSPPPAPLVERRGPPNPLAGITVRQAVLGTLVVLGIALLFWMLWRFRFVAFAVIAATFLHIGMKPAVEALHRRGVRREIGVFAVYGILLLVIVGFLLVLVPMLSAQVGSFLRELPDYYRLVRNWMLASDIDLLPRLARQMPPAWDIASLQTIVLPLLGGAGAGASSPWLFASRVGQVIFVTFAVLAMGFYWTMDRDRIVYGAVLRLPAARRDPARELIAELETKVGAFIRGQLILCAAVGLLALVAYFLIGLPYALALAAVAFVFEAVPMLGPVLAAIPAAIVAATVGPDKLMWVLIASVAIQTAENNVLVPRIMDRAVGVNAIVTILAITAFTLLFGIPGALLAIPLAAMIQVIIDRTVFSRGLALDDLMETEPATPVGAGAAAAAAVGGSRTHLDVLRLQAAELAQDVRRQQRNAEADMPAEFTAIDDLIEQTADELAQLLAQVAAAEAPAIQPTAPAPTAPTQPMGVR